MPRPDRRGFLSPLPIEAPVNGNDESPKRRQTRLEPGDCVTGEAAGERTLDADQVQHAGGRPESGLQGQPQAGIKGRFVFSRDGRSFRRSRAGRAANRFMAPKIPLPPGSATHCQCDRRCTKHRPPHVGNFPARPYSELLPGARSKQNSTRLRTAVPVRRWSVPGSRWPHRRPGTPPPWRLRHDAPTWRVPRTSVSSLPGCPGCPPGREPRR